MGYYLSEKSMNQILAEWQENYLIYAPKLYEGEGAFSDTDLIRYGEVSEVDEIVTDRKSRFSFKEILTPVSEVLFYFTENQVKEADVPRKKGAIVFLRSCDLHAVKRFDEIYMINGAEDYYYKRLRENIKFVLIGCNESFDNCFCVSMGTNQSDAYDMSFDRDEKRIHVDCKCVELESYIKKAAAGEVEVTPLFVRENNTKVRIPENLSLEVMKSGMWEEYDGRCINCGRCNFSCPTCTCFSMQDIFYTDNGRVGERRRVWASCMVNGYTDVAGGGSYRKKNGERMRFKVLHKVYDYKKRYGYHMCVGCGRCDDVCPEYISFANCVNKLEEGMKGVESNDK